jgi:hypothetical protein
MATLSVGQTRRSRWEQLWRSKQAALSLRPPRSCGLTGRTKQISVAFMIACPALPSAFQSVDSALCSSPGLHALRGSATRRAAYRTVGPIGCSRRCARRRRAVEQKRIHRRAGFEAHGRHRHLQSGATPPLSPPARLTAPIRAYPPLKHGLSMSRPPRLTQLWSSGSSSPATRQASWISIHRCARRSFKPLCRAQRGRRHDTSLWTGVGAH